MKRLLIALLLMVVLVPVLEAAPRRIRRFRPVRVRNFVNPFFVNPFRINFVNVNDFAFNRVDPNSPAIRQNNLENNPKNQSLDAQIASGSHSLGFNGVDPLGRGGPGRPVDISAPQNRDAGRFGLGLQDSSIFQNSVIALSRRETTSSCSRDVVLGNDGQILFRACNRIGECSSQSGGFVGQFEVSRIRALVDQAKQGTLSDVGQGNQQCRQTARIEEAFVGNGGQVQIGVGQIPCGTLQRNSSSATPGLIQVLRNLERRFDTRLLCG